MFKYPHVSCCRVKYLCTALISSVWAIILLWMPWIWIHTGRRQDVGEIQSPLCISNVPSGCSKGLQNMCPETIKRHFVIIIIFYCYGYYQVLVYFIYKFILPMNLFYLWLNFSMSPFGVPLFLCRCVHQLRAWSEDCCWIAHMWEQIRNLECDEQEIRSQGKHFTAFWRVLTENWYIGWGLYQGAGVHHYTSVQNMATPQCFRLPLAEFDKMNIDCLKGLERLFGSIWDWKLWHGFLLIWTWLWGFIACLISRFV